jgi:DNA-binding response OmpR family regulator
LVLENLRANLYDLLVLDIWILQMNGIKLCRELRKIDNIVKVCFVTAGRVEDKVSSNVIDLKENQFIQMPIEYEKLIKN